MGCRTLDLLMTLAEVFVLILVGATLYVALRPVQRWLERRLTRSSRGRVYPIYKDKP